MNKKEITKRDFIVRRSIYLIENKPHVESYSEQELIRCKDCAHRGNPEKCIVANNAYNKGLMLISLLDNNGEWFCADGERK